MLHDFWKNIFNAGIFSTDDIHIQRKIRLSNIVSFSGGIVSFIFSSLWFLNSEFGQGIFFILMVILMASVIVMNNAGKYRISRFLGIFGTFLFLTYYALLGGPKIGVQYIFLMSPIVIFVVFDFKSERAFIYSLLGVLIVFIVGLEAFGFNNITPIPLSNFQLFIFYYTHVALSLGMTFLFLTLLLKDTVAAEEKLSNQQIELEIQKQKAEKTAQIKSDFLSNMSHEMRTPLNSILGFTEILESSTLDTSQQEYLGYVKKASTNMLGLINDVLDFSKFDSSDFTLHKHQFQLTDLIDDVWGLLSVSSKNKNITFTHYINEQINPSLLGDANRLRQILINILSNAIKFTNEGSVHLSINLVHQNDSSQQLQFEITDTGIGIKEEDLSIIFESFRQLENSSRKEHKGTGLGLAIVKQLVKAIGGTIQVKSRLNKGSKFTIQLPFEISKEAQNIPLNDSLEIPLIKTSRILVVEDNEMNQILIKKMLSIFEAEVVIASDGYEALSFLEKNTFDIILMDLQMPGLSGLDVFDTLISDPQYSINKATPVIIITADAFVETRKKALNRGIRAFLTKPINKEEMYKTINFCLLNA